MNEPHSTPASKTGRGPLRRAAVLLALLLGAALVAGPVTAEAAPRTAVVASTAQQATSVRDLAQPVEAAGQSGRHAVAGKSSVLASKKATKSKKSKKKKSFFKKLGIFLLILVILFIAFVVFVIWFIVSRLRRRRDRH